MKIHLLDEFVGVEENFHKIILHISSRDENPREGIL